MSNGALDGHKDVLVPLEDFFGDDLEVALTMMVCVGVGGCVLDDCRSVG